jgi:hypothetical protein
VVAFAALAFGPCRSTRGNSGACSTGGAEPVSRAIVLDVRAPRVALGLLVGASLGMSGSVLQGALRNALAEPYLLGVSGGARGWRGAGGFARDERSHSTCRSRHSSVAWRRSLLVMGIARATGMRADPACCSWRASWWAPLPMPRSWYCSPRYRPKQPRARSGG